MIDKPNTDLLSELFHSQEWDALKVEIEQYRDNSLFRLKREGEVNREYQAGVVYACEYIIKLENKYKDAPIIKGKHE